MAAYGKTRIGERRKRLRPIRGASEQPKRAYSIYEVPEENWIYIPVPPIVSAELFETVQEQLVENKKRYRLRREGANHLLQGLMVCKKCGYAYSCKYTWKKSKPDGRKAQYYVYYRCTGTGKHDFEGHRICSNRAVRSDLLDKAVWEDVCSFLSDPQRIRKEYQRRLNNINGKKSWDSQDHLRSAMKKLKRGIERMIDAYADGLLSKQEFEPRIKKAKQRLTKLEGEQKNQADEEMQRNNLRLIIGCMQEFSEKIEKGIKGLDWEAKRKITCAIVKQIEIDEDEVKIIYRVSPNNLPQNLKKESLQYCSRRIIATGEKAFDHLSDPLQAGPSVCGGIVLLIGVGELLEVFLENCLKGVRSAMGISGGGKRGLKSERKLRLHKSL
jgi:site-specific DNA recombinase